MQHRFLRFVPAMAVALSFGCGDDSTNPDDPSTTSSASTTGAGTTTSTSVSTTGVGGAGGSGGSGGSTSDGGAGGAGGAGGGAGCEAFTVNVGSLRAESIKRLSDFFDETDSFADGTFFFNEGMSAYDGCPA